LDEVVASELPEQWLRRIVTDLLDIGSVGLYEFIWLLNGSDFHLVDADNTAIACKVAKGIVGSRQALLNELAWPSGRGTERAC
jgi:hypothetical protein